MLEFRVLGTFDLRDRDAAALGDAVRAQPKRAALLAYLALARPRGFHTRDTLIGIFWPDAREARARNGLSQTLHFLRRRVGEDLVITRSEEVGLDFGRLWCDALTFDDAAERGDHETALRLYAGDLLKGFHLADHLEFERWLEHERSRLQASALQCALSAARADEASGNLAGTAHRLRQALQWSPYDEAVLRQLLHVLDALGDRAGAVREYEAFVRRLFDDLELQPSDTTRGIVAAITTRDAAEGAQNASPTQPGGPLAAPARRAETDVAPERPRPAFARENAPRFRPSRRLVTIAASVAVVLAAVGHRAWQRLDDAPQTTNNRVLVAEFENRTGDARLDALGRIAADWTIQGLARAGVVEVVPLITLLQSRRANTPIRDVDVIARDVGAGLIVAGSYVAQGDSVLFQAHVTETGSGRVVRTIGPVGAAVQLPLGGVEKLRRLVTGALATVVDQRLASWADRASQPPSYDVYRVYTEGLDLFARRELPSAIERFRQAAEADSGFTVPLIWIMLAYHAVDRIDSIDAMARALSARRDELAPWDRAMLDYHLAYARGNRDASYRAMRRVVEITPAPEWIILAAREALGSNRPRAALQLLERLEPERIISATPVASRYAYASVRADAHHRVSQYARELEIVRAHPSRSAMLQALAEVPPLAGLGRPNEAISGVRKQVSAVTWSFDLAMRLIAAAEELRAHDQADAARELLAGAIQLYPRAPEEIRRDGQARNAYARTLYAAERWDEAKRVLAELMAENFHPWVLRGHLGLIAAVQGDRAEAERMSQWYADVSNRPRFDQGWTTQWRARIAALLGDRDSAVRLMRQAFAEGWWHRPGHGGQELQRLRGYAPFDELMRPRD